MRGRFGSLSGLPLSLSAAILLCAQVGIELDARIETSRDSPLGFVRELSVATRIRPTRIAWWRRRSIGRDAPVAAGGRWKLNQLAIRQFKRECCSAAQQRCRR